MKVKISLRAIDEIEIQRESSSEKNLETYPKDKLLGNSGITLGAVVLGEILAQRDAGNLLRKKILIVCYPNENNKIKNRKAELFQSI